MKEPVQIAPGPHESLPEGMIIVLRTMCMKTRKLNSIFLQQPMGSDCIAQRTKFLCAVTLS